MKEIIEVKMHEIRIHANALAIKMLEILISALKESDCLEDIKECIRELKSANHELSKEAYIQKMLSDQQIRHNKNTTLEDQA